MNKRSPLATSGLKPSPSTFKLALVTGASSGLGEAICHLLAANNIPLLITGRNLKRLETVAAALPVPVEIFPSDLSQDRSHLVQCIRERAPDLVINNAGFTFYGPALMHSASTQLDILEVNAAALLEISLESARALLAQKRAGVILNVSSTAGEFSLPAMAVYSASKAFATSLSKSLDAELKPHSIRVLAALPGPIDTPFAARASKNRFHQTSRFALKKEYVAEKIWQQIIRRKPVQIIGFQNCLLLFFSRLIPRRLFEKLFQIALRSRFSSSA